MNFQKNTFIIFCTAILLSGCANVNEVVKVDRAIITKKEFHQAYKQEIIAAHNDAKITKKIHTPEEIKKITADHITTKELFIKEYSKYNVTQKEIDELYQTCVKLAGSEEELKKQNELSGLNEEAFRLHLELKLKRKKILQNAGLYKLSDEEVKKFYQDNSHLYNIDETFEVYHILTKTNTSEIKERLKKQDKANKLKLEELNNLIREEAKKNRILIEKLQKEVTVDNFEQMAKLYSQDTETAANGGYLGIIKAYESPSQTFAGQILNQEAGTISPITKTKYGSHLIYLKNKTPYISKTFEQVKEDAWLRLMDLKEYDLTLDYINELKKDAKIIYYDKTLSPEYMSLKDKIKKAFNKKSRKK